MKGFVATLSKGAPVDGHHGVFALDCEMCYTTEGPELTRVTVVGSDRRTVYETLVKPDNPILDHNTRFSGITEEDLIGVRTTIRDVQAVLLNQFSDKTILIGHSFDSDLRALRVTYLFIDYLRFPLLLIRSRLFCYRFNCFILSSLDASIHSNDPLSPWLLNIHHY